MCSSDLLSYQYCLAYVKLLNRRKKTTEAVKIAEMGIELFPAHLTPDLYTIVNRYYEKHDPQKYKDNLIHLFYQTGGWKYYDTLKNSLSEDEWHNVFQEMVAYLTAKGSSQSSRIIDMYLREKLHDRALELVLEADDLEVLAAYHSKLSDKYPEQYFASYQSLIGNFIEGHKGRPYYRRAVTFLKKMRSIKGMGENYDAFLKLLRERYHTRRAFLEEIRRL